MSLGYLCGGAVAAATQKTLKMCHNISIRKALNLLKTLCKQEIIVEKKISLCESVKSTSSEIPSTFRLQKVGRIFVCLFLTTSGHIGKFQGPAETECCKHPRMLRVWVDIVIQENR